MNVARNAAEALAEHATLERECVNRMYLNVYVPVLQTGAGAAHFFKKVRGNPVPSSALMTPMTRRFVRELERYTAKEGVDLMRFERHERKDECTRRPNQAATIQGDGPVAELFERRPARQRQSNFCPEVLGCVN